VEEGRERGKRQRGEKYELDGERDKGEETEEDRQRGGIEVENRREVEGRDRVRERVER
jgi:hypothetical protein